MQHDGWLEACSTAASPGTTWSSATSASPATIILDADAFRMRSASAPPTNGCRSARSRNRTNSPRWITFEKIASSDRHQGRRHLRLLRLQRIVRRRGRACQVQGDLDGFIKHTLAQKYNGKSPPRLVLFSPIAHEDLKDRNLPDGTANNKRLATLHRGHGRGRQGQQRSLRGPVPPDARHCTPRPTKPFTHQRHPPDRARQPSRWPRSSTGPVRPAIRSRERRARGPGKDPPGGPRQELLLVQPLPHGRRLLDLRRPGRPEVRRTADQPRGRPARDGSARRDDRQPRQADLGRRQGGDLKVDDANTPPFIPVKTNKPGTGPTASTSSSTARRPSRR